MNDSMDQIFAGSDFTREEKNVLRLHSGKIEYLYTNITIPIGLNNLF